MKKSRSILVSLAFACAVIIANAQTTAPGIEWQNTIGGSADDHLYSFQQTSDGGYILGGESVSGISSDKSEASLGIQDYWVVKLNSMGAIEWQNTIGGAGGDFLYSIEQTSDGGYILGGYSSSGISGDKTEASQGSYDYWVVKLNSSGAIEWQNTIGGSGEDDLRSIEQTSDGGYIVGGWSSSGISGDKTEALSGSADYWILKLNSTGGIEWQNTIGGSSGDYLYSVEQTSDGGYILGGESSSGISGDKSEASLGSYDYWVVKLNSGGTIDWQNTIGGDGYDELRSIQQTSDNGYIVGGWSPSSISGDKTEASLGADDYWVVKLNSSGAIDWQNTIGGNGYDYLYSIQQLSDGGYILGGGSASGLTGDKTEASLGGYDYWVVKLNKSGTIDWQNTIGGSVADILYAVQATSDGGYLLAGNSSSVISGDKTEASLGGSDYWVVKLACHATVTPSGSVSTCDGTAVTLTANGGPGATYQWIKNTKNISGGTNQTYSAKKEADYKVTVTTPSGCSSTSDLTTLTVLPTPDATITPLGDLDICSTGSVVLEANSGIGYSYQWKKGTVIQAGETNQTYTATKKGTYKVIVTNSDNCSKTSSGTKVTNSCRESEQEITSILSYSIIPNPTSQSASINYTLLAAQFVTIQLHDVFGKTLRQLVNENEEAGEHVLKFDPRGLPDGIYLMQILSGDEIKTQKVIISH